MVRRRSQQVGSDEEMPNSSGAFEDLSEDDQVQLVKRLIRYMICRNAKRKPVRRADLSKYVLANHEEVRGRARLFNATFEQARLQLEQTWGMRVVEVFKKTRANPTAGSSRRQTPSQSDSGGFSKAYVLVSTLPDVMRAENKREWPLFGFLTVVAGIIALTPEARIEEDALHRSLARLGTHVRETRGHGQLNGGNVKELLDNILVGQWYLERVKDDDGWWYKIGPRLWAELEFTDLITFIEAVYNESGTGATGIDENARKELTTKLEAVMSESLDLGDD